MIVDKVQLLYDHLNHSQENVWIEKITDEVLVGDALHLSCQFVANSLMEGTYEPSIDGKTA